jgi:arsenate reductase-like glutaredoxin family protein
MKSTFLEYFQFVATANNFLAQHPEESKLKYALEKVGKLNKNLSDDYSDAVEDCRIDFCETDEKGIILRDEKGQYKFTKENTKKFNAAVKALQNKEIEVNTWAYDLSEDEFTNEEAKAIFEKFLVADEKFKVQ